MLKCRLCFQLIANETPPSPEFEAFTTLSHHQVLPVGEKVQRLFGASST